MLTLKPNCENCNTHLPNESTETMICSFECTFCANCVQHVLQNVCPNCGGSFEKRPHRPKEKLLKYPTSTISFVQSVNLIAFEALLQKNKNIKPNER